MATYFLANHVFLCHRGNQVVLLDLKNDKYLALQESNIRALAGLIHGWSASPEPGAVAGGDSCSGSDECAATPFADTLVARGLLTIDSAAGKAATPIALEPPALDLVEEDITATPSMRPHHVKNFCVAVLVATTKLRWRSIEHVVQRVRRRRERHLAPKPGLDLAAARQLVGIYYKLRPFVFTARDACLFDALALLEFLARYGLFPSWVFGIQTAPFAAHCWVQNGEVVFNDTADHVRNYTPIMAV